ncbi:putative FBD-associated F-box protein At5g22720 isoform X2 [Raphanus sativus]|uniref:FBD-associated F-box protein At5g22720 isoform X2 n=1 Tax=Raphanus sativus TaxID=3726 RepID=A0A6J0NH68_RAPSA|nr:putative FBD-associated F-box protein At5g22720 isoform X2 [Raphanus sativus]
MEEINSKERGGRCVDISRENEDMISYLPDTLLSQVLSYLPTKEAVRTSVLSTRWKSLWLFISEIDLDTCQFPDYNAFVIFMEKFLDFSRTRVEKPCFHKVKLSLRKNVNDPPCVTRWIELVATPELDHLDFECDPVLLRECLEVMPPSLYTSCQKLLHLRLHRVFVGTLLESVSLPCLKTMRLEYNTYASEVSLELLISSCPVLEDFSFVRKLECGVNVLRVHSKTLTSLSIETGIHDSDFKYADWDDDCSVRVLINTPRLKYLNLDDFISECKTISNLGSLTNVNLLSSLYTINSDDAVFNNISGVRDMSISSTNFTVIKNIKTLPQFCNLSCLKAELYFWDIDVLPMFLEICPNLRICILHL